MVHFVYFAANQEHYRNLDTFWSTNYLVYCTSNDTDFRIWKKKQNEHKLAKSHFFSHSDVDIIYTWAGCGMEIDFISCFVAIRFWVLLLLSIISSMHRLGWRRDGVRLNAGGALPCVIASRTACFSVRPLNRIENFANQFIYTYRLCMLAVTPLNLDCVSHRGLWRRGAFNSNFNLPVAKTWPEGEYFGVDIWIRHRRHTNQSEKGVMFDTTSP